jgi:hypothetical protein
MERDIQLTRRKYDDMANDKSDEKWLEVFVVVEEEVQ